MPLRFVPSESTDWYFPALRGCLEDGGLAPVARHWTAVLVRDRMPQDTKLGKGVTQFGRALSQTLHWDPVRKVQPGERRVERAECTLQARLATELRVAAT